VRDVRASVGAGFIYPLIGEMATIPGVCVRERRRRGREPVVLIFVIIIYFYFLLFLSDVYGRPPHTAVFL